MSRFATTLRIMSAVVSRLLLSRFFIVVVLLSLVFLLMINAPLLTMKELKAGGEFGDFREMKGTYLRLSIMMIGWMGNVIAIILGSTVIRQDIKDATIFSVLSKPVSRLEYFIGNSMAAILCQCIVWLIFGSFWLLFVYMLDGAVEPVYFSICLGEMLKSTLMVALAIAWAQRFSPWVAGVLALLTFNGELLAAKLIVMIKGWHIIPTRHLGDICTFPFPDFGGLDQLTSQLGETSIEAIPLFWPVLHIIDYALVVLLLAWLYFKKQDLSANN